jgi:hypothetical protein
MYLVNELGALRALDFVNAWQHLMRVSFAERDLIEAVWFSNGDQRVEFLNTVSTYPVPITRAPKLACPYFF